MTEQEFQTMKAQITADVLRGMEKEKRSRAMVRRVMDEYDPEFEAFDWIEHFTLERTGGTSMERDYPRHEAHKLRNAIGTIIRIVLQEPMVQKIPEEKEPEIRRIINGILCVMKEVKA